MEAIAEIIEQNGHAHTKDIADKLNVKMPSVTSALQALSMRGLINYQSHTPVVLTSSGTEAAAVIRNRHKALKNFFAQVLKLDEREANATACEIEHVANEKVLSRIVLLAEAIAQRPDCAELREYLDKTMPNLNVDDSEAEVISLAELPLGQSAVVVKVAENLRGIRKFADLGLVPGTLVVKEGKAPLGNLLRIKVMGSSLSLRSDDAGHIWVRLTE